MTENTPSGGASALLRDLQRNLDGQFGLETVQLWEGPFRAASDPGRISMRMPAALIAIHTMAPSTPALRAFPPGQLRAGDIRMRPPTPHVSVEVGVTLLASDPSSEQRLLRLADLGAAVTPVLVGFGMRDVRGTNLYVDRLTTAGLGAFIVVGKREYEDLGPDPNRVVPRSVEMVTGQERLRIYPPVGDC